MIDPQLKAKFEEVLELEIESWGVFELVVQRNANVLRPIKGIAFEEYFKKMLRAQKLGAKIEDGIGDSDVDMIVNGRKIQVKTPLATQGGAGKPVNVALHKTHGEEKRPGNLYKISGKTFDYLVVLHPEAGIYVVPYNEVQEHPSWPGYLSDPASLPWESKWLNKWSLLGIEGIDGKRIDDRTIPSASQLPFLSELTLLEDHEIITMLCKPEYFRAAVMGLKGNLKEYWFEEYLKNHHYKISPSTHTYSKYDLIVHGPQGDLRVQTKGTSKGMCNTAKSIIGVEVMGTHSWFPIRGYKRSYLEYVAVIISSHQLPRQHTSHGLHFVMLPIKDLPLHYNIGRGKETGRPAWDDPEYADVIYPNIKLTYQMEGSRLAFRPAVSSYGKHQGIEVLPADSPFRKAGPYFLDTLPAEFKS